MRSAFSLLRSPVVWGLLAGAALGIGLAACASKSQAPASSAVLDPRRNEISELWMQIRQWRVDDLELPAEPVARRMNLMPIPIEKIRTCRVDKDPATEVCKDICNVKDAICDNAESICRIADELGDDDWADDKCRSAKTSCKEATQKCCGCTEREPAAGSDLQRTP